MEWHWQGETNIIREIHLSTTPVYHKFHTYCLETETRPLRQAAMCLSHITALCIPNLLVLHKNIGHAVLTSSQRKSPWYLFDMKFSGTQELVRTMVKTNHCQHNTNYAAHTKPPDNTWLQRRFVWIWLLKEVTHIHNCANFLRWKHL
jgi:hypothetical protein